MKKILHSHKKTAGIKTPQQKTIKLKHHHHKPYRKRHLTFLTLSLLLVLALLIFIIIYQLQASLSIKEARSTISDIFGNQGETTQVVSSSLGFSLEYNNLQYYVGAVDSASGYLFTGEELSMVRPYETIKVSPYWLANNYRNTSLTISFGKQYSSTLPSDIEDTLMEQAVSMVGASLSKISSQEVFIGGEVFLQTSWRLTPTNPLVAKLTADYVTYVGAVNGSVVTIVVVEGFSDGIGELFEPVLNSIKFTEPNLPTAQKTPEANSRSVPSRTFLDSMMFASLASAAAENETSTPSETISSLYSPAVVKIYNFYCMDVAVGGVIVLVDACNALTGSGFFVSKDGYVATNGHVAQMDAEDVLFYNAIIEYMAGNTQYLVALARIAGLTEADLAAAITSDEAAVILLNRLYEIPDGTITAENKVSNLLVGLNQESPDLNELSTLTTQRKAYTEQDSIRRAVLVGYDYRMLDGIGGFQFSDVALLKINNDNLPVVELGNIDSLSQGSNLTILGFPGAASDNGLVEGTESKVTLTGGKVSSIKNATGNSGKLVETDTTIGFGNSGGPAFSDDMKAIGIATYTVDSSTEGSGVFNYVRDIKDLTDLAAKKSITLNTTSPTQTEWEKAIGLFNRARYSKSLTNFNEVKSLYPQHPTVAEFIAIAKQRIQNGQDIKDFPLVWIIVIGVVGLGGIAGSIFVIIRHKKAHEVYKQQVASGNLVPLTKNSPSQLISFNQVR